MIIRLFICLLIPLTIIWVLMPENFYDKMALSLEKLIKKLKEEQK